MKQLYVDCQLLQTNAWHRGMGKYTLQLLAGIDATKKIRLVLIFNSSLEISKKRIEAIEYFCPNSKIVIKKIPCIQSQKEFSLKEAKQTIEGIIKQDSDNNENYYLITSLFTFDYFPVFPNNAKKLLLFYDLIPLLHWRDLGGYFPPDIYMSRFDTLFESDLIMSISQNTKEDIMKVFGINERKVININGGFTKVSKSSKKPETKLYDAPYILFPSGDLPHKNNLTAIRGYATYRKKTQNPLNIVITSHFSKKTQKKLKKVSDGVIFAGNVIDEELEWLYENAALVLFASKYEGLGLPVLDAVANKKPVVISNAPVFKEMSSSAFYIFDKNNPDALADSVIAAQKKSINQEEYKSMLQKYTWQKSAQQFLGNLGQTCLQYDMGGKVAVVGMDPGIGSTLGFLLEHIAANKSGEIDFYLDTNGVDYRKMLRPTFLNYIKADCYEISNFNIFTYYKYDKVIYLCDESSIVSRLLQRAYVLPGIMLFNFDKINSDKDKKIAEKLLSRQYATKKIVAPNNTEGYNMLTGEMINLINSINYSSCEKKYLIKSKAKYISSRYAVSQIRRKTQA